MNPALADLGRELARDVLFDEGVEAARNACVAGASIASAAITAAAWYDNPLTGVPALVECMARLSRLSFDVDVWIEALLPAPHPETQDVASPGFGFVGGAQARAVVEACERLVAARGGVRGAPRATFFLEHQRKVQAACGPLNHAGLAALFFVDHGVDAAAAERTFLVWRIDTAIQEAQRARARGLGAFPFFSQDYVYEGERPPERTLDVEPLRRELGLV